MEILKKFIEAPDEIPKSKKHIKFFYSSVVICLFIKLIFVLIPFYEMNGPRMGDDSLTYQWKGHLLFNQSEYYQSKTFTNLKSLSEKPVPNEWLRNRFEMRSTSLYAPLYSALNYSISKLGQTLQFNDALSEVIVGFFFTLGIAFFYINVSSPLVACFSLLITSIMFDRMNASHLTQAFAFFSWGLILESKNIKSTFGYAWLNFFMTLAHPVGKAYAVQATLLTFIKGKLSTVILPLMGIILALVFEYIISFKHGHVFMGGGGLSLKLETFLVNFKALFHFCYIYYLQTAICLLAFIFLTIKICRYKNLTSFEILLSTSFVLTMISLFHDVPGHPIEAFTRFFFPLTYLSIPFVLDKYLGLKLKRMVTAFIILLLSVLMSHGLLKPFLKTIKTNISKRSYFFDEDKLRHLLKSKELQRLPVIFAESDYSMFYTMMFKSYKLNTFSFSSFQQDPSLFYHEKRVIVCSPMTRMLNPASLFGTSQFSPAFHGLIVNHKYSPTIVSPYLEEITFFFESEHGAQLKFIKTDADTVSEGLLHINKDAKINYRFSFTPSSFKKELRFKSNEVVKITRMKSDENDLLWPWMLKTQVKYNSSGNIFKFDYDEINEVEFKFKLRGYSFQQLISDDSGLVCATYIRD